MKFGMKTVIPKMILVGICGKMGSGKDYVASNYVIPYLEKVLKKKAMCFSMADQIKVNAMTKHNLSYEQVYVKKTKETRRLLQVEGTEHGRQVYGEDIWIKYYSSWLQVLHNKGIDCIITPDIRFQNEAQYIKDNNGILIKVVAPSRNEKRLQDESKGDRDTYNKMKTHQSECDLDDLPDNYFHLVIDNDQNDTNTQREVVEIILHSKLARQNN